MEARDSGQRMAELEARYHVLHRRAVEIRQWLATIEIERAAILRECEEIEDRLLD
jgi:hypothetical protein